MSDDIDRSRSRRIDWPGELICWVLFLFSAIFFVVSALRSGDMPALIGALLFLSACVVFLVTYVGRTLRSRDPT